MNNSTPITNKLNWRSSLELTNKLQLKSTVGLVAKQITDAIDGQRYVYRGGIWKGDHSY